MIKQIAGATTIPKHLAVEKAILDGIRLGRFPKGSRLPPDRELAHRLKVNPLTLQPAMRRLCRQGILERRPRVGTFVRTAVREPNVALLVFNNRHNAFALSPPLFQTMQDEGAPRGHQVRPIHLMRPFPPLDQLRDELHAMRAGAIGLLDFLNTDRDFILQLAELWPCVLLNKGLNGTGLPCVTPDMYAAARLVVDFFASRGRTRVAAGVFNIHHQRHSELAIALEGECLRRGLVADRRLWRESDSFDLQSGEEWLDQLRREAHPPDALAICSGVSREATEAWLRATGMTLGRELDLVHFRIASATARSRSPWPVLAYDDQNASLTAMRLLFDLVEGKVEQSALETIRLPVTLEQP